jgi:8-oxo-dGTP pyrophosphatase MutT (NUDIX family)
MGNGNKGHKVLSRKKIKIRDKDSGYEKNITLKTIKMPNGLEEDFFIDNDKHSVQVFAITEDEEQVICVTQFRPGAEEIMLELPGGGLEDGEDAAKAASRELREETGYTGNPPVHLSSPEYSPYNTGIRHMYMITGCKKTEKLDLDPNEFVKVEVIPMDKFRKLMQEGKVRGYESAYMGLDKLGKL